MAWKSFLAVLAGYGVMVVATMLLFAMLAYLSPAQFGREANKMPGTLIIVVILFVGLFAAVGGGWTTGRLAPSAPSGHVLALVAIVLALGLVSLLMQSETPAPTWYRIGLLVVGTTGAFLGGKI